MNGDDLRTRLRGDAEAGRSVLMPGVWDDLSARAAVTAGFDVVFVSGFAVAGTLLALPVSATWVRARWPRWPPV